MPSGVHEALGALWEDARGALTERLRLLSLEARLATMTVIQVIVIAVVVAVLAVTSWLLLVGAVFAAFVAAGLHWGIAVALLIAVNVGVAFALVKTAIKLASRVSLPRSLRQLASRSDKH
jgi:pilus assembly protein TadC